MPVIADLHHFDEELDPDPHQCERSDPNPRQSEKSDSGPHQRDADPQHRQEATVGGIILMPS
jgi:hypothetical protein